jgi:hypothetical protein
VPLRTLHNGNLHRGLPPEADWQERSGPPTRLALWVGTLRLHSGAKGGGPDFHQLEPTDQLATRNWGVPGGCVSRIDAANRTPLRLLYDQNPSASPSLRFGWARHVRIIDVRQVARYGDPPVIERTNAEWLRLLGGSGTEANAALADLLDVIKRGLRRSLDGRAVAVTPCLDVSRTARRADGRHARPRRHGIVCVRDSGDCDVEPRAHRGVGQCRSVSVRMRPAPRHYESPELSPSEVR